MSSTDGALSPPEVLGSLRKSFTSNGEAVLLSVQATNLVQRLMERGSLLPPATVHLGQACMAALLIQGLSDPDDHEKIELQWKSEGPFGSLYADAIGDGQVRATIQNGQAVGDGSTLQISLGAGLLQLRRSKAEHGAPAWAGLVKSSGFVAEDLAHYLEQSEQKNCGLSLSVKLGWDAEKQIPFVESAAGYLVHILPVIDEKERNRILLSWDRHMTDLGPVSQWLLPIDDAEATGEILKFLTGGRPQTEAFHQTVKLFCTCSEERAKRAISLLSSGERKSLLEKDDDNFVVVDCEFCGSHYRVPVTV